MTEINNAIKNETEKTSATVAAEATAVSNTKPRRRIIRRKKKASEHNNEQNNTPPSELLLSISKSSLPSNYNFEIFKTIQKIKSIASIKNETQIHVALQFPEGLLMYSCVISDIIKRFLNEYTLVISILGDVTYGACCIDDLGAQALGCDLLVHYGHSCLVPVQHTAIPCLYVFVEIHVDVSHLVECVCVTVPEYTTLYVMGTIQFRSAVVEASKELKTRNRPCIIPQSKPLSPGEVLGCTAPHIPITNANIKNTTILFIADGRFHMEAAMISNPNIPTLRYDPYGKILSKEYYNHLKMLTLRSQAIHTATTANKWGIILGTLGRQGNPAILIQVKKMLSNKPHFILLLSEVYPAKLKLYKDVEAWVQIACPRLSIDWGSFFHVPILNPYELTQCMALVKDTNTSDLSNWQDKSKEFYYPMDYYSKDVDGIYGNYHNDTKGRCEKLHCTC